MGIEPKQLKRLITDVLHGIGYYSDEAVDLLMLTAAQESEMGRYLYQLGNGPARGIFQMEPATHRCLYENYLKNKSDLVKKPPASSDFVISWLMLILLGTSRIKS